MKFNNISLYSFFGLLIMLASTSLQAQPIEIEVNNINVNRGGNIIAFLYARDGFPKDHSKAVAISTLAADSEKLTFTFETDLENFAIKILHDEDKTGTVSKNWTGIVPIEGLGFSNGARLTLTGPPKFRRAVLASKDVRDTIKINMIYPRRAKKRSRR